MRFIVLILSLLFVSSPALADGSADPVVAADHGSASAEAGSGSSTTTTTITSTTGPTQAPSLPDPVADPLEAGGVLWKLYKAGHLVPALIVLAFFLLFALQKWVAWLRTGYRKLIVAAALGALGMMAERVSDGSTPNFAMVTGALFAAMALYMKTEGEPKKVEA